MSVSDLLLRHALAQPHRPAIHFEGATLSYGELARASSGLAVALATRGVQPGDRVALLLSNTPAFVIAYFAVQRLGALAVSIGVMSSRNEVEFVLRDAAARVLIVDADLLDRVPAVPCVEHVLVAGPGEPGEHSLERLALTAGDPPRCAAGPETAAAILYTSGTTGQPKGAVLSTSNVRTNAEAAAECYGAAHTDRFLLFLPLFHCFGQNAILNAAFTIGAAVVLHRRFVPELVLASVRNGEVSHFFAVPSIYVRLLALGVTREEFQHVCYFFSAAAPLPSSVSTRWAQLMGRNIHEGYGLTETSPFATYNHRSAYRLGSVGTPVRGVRVRVVGSDGSVLPSDQIGEIEISGPNVMLGYWNRPEETARARSQSGWFRSGDLGRLDQDDYLFVVDRIKEMIIVSGYKVYPSEVENALLEHHSIAEIAVFGVPHSYTDEEVHARVVPCRDARIDALALTAFCAERLAKYKIPKHFELAEALPKSAAGKVLRRVLRDEVVRRRSSAAQTVSSQAQRQKLTPSGAE